MKRTVWGIVVMMTLLACGEDSPTAVGPPANANVAGTWTGTTVVSNVEGSGCTSNFFRAAAGSVESYGSLNIVQGGSALSARWTGSSGIVCDYSGSIGGTTVTLNVQSCTFECFTFREEVCRDGTAGYCVVASAIIGTVNGSTMMGVDSSTLQVFDGFGNPFGVVRVEARVTLTR